MRDNAAALENVRSPGTATGIRCLIVVPALIRAGAETQAIDLANGLAGKGHAIHLCSFEPQLDQRDRIAGSVRFHHVLRRSKYDWTLVQRLAALMDREEIDVVLGVLQFATLAAWLASRRSQRKPRVVAAVHTTINRGLKEEIHDRLLYRRMLRGLPAVVFVCEHQRTHWLRKYPELAPVSRVVHNGVSPERFRLEEFADAGRQLRRTLSIPEQGFVFASIAAFRPEKGHKLLLDAFAEVRDEAWLVLAGEGALRASMEAHARATGLGDRVRFLGSIPDPRPLLAASNATVLASTAVETFSMAMLESMAMGVPMIAPRIGGLPEAIVPDETGLLFPVGDTAELARCLRAVTASPSKAADMGRLAREKLVREFTFAKMVAGTERVLAEALGPTGRRRPRPAAADQR